MSGIQRSKTTNFELKSPLVQVMAYRLLGVKPLSKPVMIDFADASNASER